MKRLASVLHHLRSIVFSLLRLRTLGSSVIAIDENENVLLVRLNYGKGDWRLPGGGVHRQETFHEAALREAHEEVGLVMAETGTVELLGVFLKRRGNWFDHVGVFVIRGWTLEQVLTWEVSEVRRFPIDQLPEDTSPAVKRRIEEWRGVRPISHHW